MNISDYARRIATSKTTEHFEPFVLGLVAALISFFCGWHMPLKESMRTGALAGSMTAGSIIFGFLTTAMVMMLNFSGSRMKQVEESGYLQDVVLYLREAIYLVLAFTLINLCGFFASSALPIYMALWLGLGAAVLSAFRRVFYVLTWLLTKPN